jgi:hypothetical protein
LLQACGLLAQRADADDVVRQEFILQGVGVRRATQGQARTVEDRRRARPSPTWPNFGHTCGG